MFSRTAFRNPSSSTTRSPASRRHPSNRRRFSVSDLTAFALLLGAFPFTAQLPAANPQEEPRVESISDTEFRLGEIEFRSDTREITFPGKVKIDDGFLEYALTHEEGSKIHETLFTTAVSPTHLQIVLKLLRYEAGRGDLFVNMLPPGEGPRGEPLGHGIDAFVQWEGIDPLPLHTLIHDQRADGPMKWFPWAYNGSEIVRGKFQAELEGSILALYIDPLAMANTLHPLRIDDDNWFPRKGFVPGEGTPVTLIFRPVPGKEDKKPAR